MTSLYITRHGQTEWNVEGRMQGQLDSPLTEVGRRQAMQLGKYIGELDLDLIITSPLGRAKETAELVGNKNYAIHELSGLQEMNLGSWQGENHDVVKEAEPENHQHFWKEPQNYSRTDGETFQDVKKRLENTLYYIHKTYRNKKVLAVSHTIAIKALLSVVLKKSLDQFWSGEYLVPTSLTLIEIDDQGYRVKFQGQTEHLEQITADFWDQ